MPSSLCFQFYRRLLNGSRRAKLLEKCMLTMVLGAAKILKTREKHLKGIVVVIFQPAGEAGNGEKNMIEDEALNDVETISAVHVFDGCDRFKTGSFACCLWNFQSGHYWKTRPCRESTPLC
ncbi:hypothetical protein DCAR_0103567 [Daucus carota subsp. sativus]|uniref:Uncharacterized protein n=1 Tax=Daucus carota subsp. sativus TaxID=79200 RepID=A0A166I3I2_DAUCS|nr:hypothetical protein DCAR_0103567 [Daucus carota subsp. sativus]